MDEEHDRQAFAERVGEQVRRLRREKRRSQEWLAEESDLSERSVGQMERGQSTISIGTMKRVANALGMKVWQFFALLDE